MNTSPKNFEEQSLKLLKENGARITQPRKLVISCLANSPKPLSAKEVYEQISKDSSASKIDQVSVYRILETLAELELVHQVFPSGGYMACFHSQCGSTLHVLIRCTSCESIKELDVPQETVAPMVSYLKNEQGFTPDDHVFQMNGLCSNCQEK